MVPSLSVWVSMVAVARSEGNESLFLDNGLTIVR